MPVVPRLFPTDSIVRIFWPKKWQRFHRDWHMHSKRSIYHKLGSDVFALVCLFEHDDVFVASPEENLQIMATNSRQFPRDLSAAARV
jgi:hypothetical protein